MKNFFDYQTLTKRKLFMTFNLNCEKYEEAKKEWPSEGRHILAHYDEESIVKHLNIVIILFILINQ